MAPKENLKPLKLLVFSMGLVLIGGTILIAGMVFKKISSETSSLTEECAGGTVNLTGRGIITESRQDGPVLRLTLESRPGRMELLTLDSCTGKTLSSLTIDSDAATSLE